MGRERAQTGHTAETPDRVRQKDAQGVYWGSMAMLEEEGEETGAAGLMQPVSWGSRQMPTGAGNSAWGSAAILSPVVDTLAAVQKHAGNLWALGWTYFPKNFKAPDFKFNVKPKFYAYPSFTQRAYEGDATSYYIGALLHKTQHKEGGKDVYWKMSASMSARDRRAEAEHVADTKYAYRISLKEADRVLKRYIVGRTIGPKDTAADAEAMVLARIQAKLRYPKLGNDKTKWANKYDMLFRKTLQRDNKHWHSFGLGNRKEIKDAKGVIQKIIYKVNRGTTKVGVVRPSKIITY